MKVRAQTLEEGMELTRKALSKKLQEIELSIVSLSQCENDYNELESWLGSKENQVKQLTNDCLNVKSPMKEKKWLFERCKV